MAVFNITPEEVADRLASTANIRGFSIPPEVRDVLVEALRSGGLDLQMRVSFHAERLKDDLEAGEFGPIEAGTPLHAIYLRLKNMFTIEWLAMHDDEGNPL